MEAIFKDIRYGTRSLLKRPGFTATAILTLALGIGVNTSIFTLFYSLALRPLPVKDAAELVNVYQTFEGQHTRRIEGNIALLSYPEYLSYRDQTQAFSGLIAYAPAPLTLSSEEGEGVRGLMVTDNYFSVLGGQTFLGRSFVPGECQTPHLCPLALLSYRFWQRRFGSDPTLIGKTLTLNRRPFTVLGITAPDFRGTENLPTRSDGPANAIALNFLLKADGNQPALPAAARDAVRSLDHNLVVSLKQLDENMDLKLHPARTAAVFSGALSLLALLLAATGIYGVMAYFVTARTREIGIRVALGAQRSDVLKLVVKNGMRLALSGVAIGLAGAFALTRLMTSFLFGVAPTDAATFAVVSVGLIAVALLACYIPARRATKVDPLVTLRYE